MAYRIYETFASGQPLASYDEDTLVEALERIASEKDANIGSSVNEGNTFRLVEIMTTERDVPFRIAIGGEERAIAMIGNVTVTA